MKIICVGRNYSEHALELKNEIPTEPILFIKPDSAVLKNDRPFYIPEFSQEIHYEVELILKIDKVGRHIQEEFAHEYFSEIALGIDFTARDLQAKLKAKGHPWEKAKGFDDSAVIGTFLPKSEFNLDDLNFSLNLNQETVQQGNTKQMIFSIPKLIAYISKYFMLKKGDIIFTGTPKGVGKIVENDILTGFINETQNLKVKIQ